MCSGVFKFTFPLNGRNSRAYKIKKNRVKNKQGQFFLNSYLPPPKKKKNKTKSAKKPHNFTCEKWCTSIKKFIQFSLDF